VPGLERPPRKKHDGLKGVPPRCESESEDDDDASGDSYAVDFASLDPHFSTGASKNSNKNKRHPVIQNRRVARNNTKRTKHDDDISELPGNDVTNSDDEATELDDLSAVDEEQDNEDADDDDDEDRNEDAKFELAVNEAVLNTVSGEMMTSYIKRIRDPVSKTCRTKIEGLQREVMPKLKCQQAATENIAKEVAKIKETSQVTGTAVDNTYGVLINVQTSLGQLQEDLNKTRAVLKDLSTWLVKKVGNLDARAVRIENHLGCALPRADDRHQQDI